MAKYTVRFYGADNQVETEQIEADSFKTSTHTNGPVTFFRGSLRSGEKIAHYNRAISVRHESLDVDNDPDDVRDGFGEEPHDKGSEFGD